MKNKTLYTENKPCDISVYKLLLIDTPRIYKMKNTTLYVGNKSYDITIDTLSLINRLMTDNRYKWIVKDKSNNVVYQSKSIVDIDDVPKRTLMITNLSTGEKHEYCYTTIVNDTVILNNTHNTDNDHMDKRLYVTKVEMVNEDELLFSDGKSRFISVYIDVFEKFLLLLNRTGISYKSKAVVDNKLIDVICYPQYSTVNNKTSLTALAIFKVDDLLHEVNGEYKPREIEDIIKIVSERTL